MLDIRRARTLCARTALLTATAALAACAGVDTDPPDPPVEDCPASLPEAPTSCDAAECGATTGDRTLAQARPSADTATEWLVVSYVGSDLFVNDNLNVSYAATTEGALTAARPAAPRLSLEARLAPRDYALLFGPARRARLAAEQRIRDNTVHARPVGPLRGSGLRVPEVEDEVLEQDTTCTAAAPDCGADALCVLGTDGMGQCSSSLTIKWRDQSAPANFEDVAATVRRVGQFGAIVTDDQDTIADADIDTLLTRFEERIAPVDHALFGEPVDAQGNDRDGNGVVILFLTSRVGEISADLAGFFQATDLMDPADVPASNGADILYMQPPGGAITLDNLSGTIAHEYQHLINYYAKVIVSGSSPEERWLDEAISSFAEDATGYGADAFKNVAAYLVDVGVTSLTGFGLVATDENEADSLQRRGMGHLLIRYLYEQAGGATLSGPAMLTDGGGVAAVRALVQGPTTGVEQFTAARTGRSLEAWVRDLLTVVAIDGGDFPGVSCNAAFTLAEPVSDDYTGYTRGVDLRTSMVDFTGATIPLNGPATTTFQTEQGVPVPANGGEIRTLSVASGATLVELMADAEAAADAFGGLRVVPTNAATP